MSDISDGFQDIGQNECDFKFRVIGVIENMSDTSCSKCGEPIAIFGTGGGAETAKQLSSLVGADVALIGKIPFATALCEGGDIGQPIVISDPTCPASESFAAIVEKITLRPKSLVGVRLSLS